MGVKDELRATLAQPLNLNGPNKPTDTFAIESKYFDGVPPAANKVDCPVKYEGASRLEDYTVSPNGRDKIGRVLSYLRQFSVDSIFNGFLNSVAGQNRAMKAASKDHLPSHSSNKNEKQDLKVLITEEVNALLKKFRGSMPQNNNSAVCATETSNKALESPKKSPDEQTEASAPATYSRKKIFIRSRL